MSGGWRQQANRIAAEARGRRGEALAADYLRALGFQIVAQRVKTPRGEVDLVAAGPGLIVFAEVKWRARSADLDLAIDERRLARVAAAAEVLIPRFADAGQDIRIDVLLLAPGQPVRHIENAWMPF